jgi:hypothetical protein
MLDYLFIIALFVFIFSILFFIYNIFISKNNVIKNELYNESIEKDFLNIEILNFYEPYNSYDIHINNVDKNNILYFLKLLNINENSNFLNENNFFKKIV